MRYTIADADQLPEYPFNHVDFVYNDTFIGSIPHLSQLYSFNKIQKNFREENIIDPYYKQIMKKIADVETFNELIKWWKIEGNDVQPFKGNYFLSLQVAAIKKQVARRQIR